MRPSCSEIARLRAAKAERRRIRFTHKRINNRIRALMFSYLVAPEQLARYVLGPADWIKTRRFTYAYKAREIRMEWGNDRVIPPIFHK